MEKHRETKGQGARPSSDLTCSRKPLHPSPVRPRQVSSQSMSLCTPIMLSVHAWAWLASGPHRSRVRAIPVSTPPGPVQGDQGSLNKCINLGPQPRTPRGGANRGQHQGQA